MPGWPAVPDSQFHESDVAGRNIIGLEANSFNIDIGGLSGYDYFGDGSFYLLDAPGVSEEARARSFLVYSPSS